ncbi:polysaccharide deacetylase family protein [Candidatus Curtissbacteria bacterium]|nr:polysaccharide deacetylase family protein [Candidatus Curtissbacteria bacterium]
MNKLINYGIYLAVVAMFAAYLVISTTNDGLGTVAAARDSAPSIGSAPDPSPSSSPPPTPEPVYKGYCLNVPVLMYHHVEPIEQARAAWHAQLTVDVGVFENQMKYLISRGYKTIFADELVDALINKRSLPAKSVVITMDDGYSDIYTYAYEILKKHDIRANLMISTGLLENPGYMTWNQLKQMVQSGHVTAYDHTWSHSSLVGKSNEKAIYEIVTAKEQLEQQLAKNQNIFAYPYGTYDSRVISLLRENGFIAAFSTDGGTIQCDSFIMSLHRVRVGNFPLSAYGI